MCVLCDDSDGTELWHMCDGSDGTRRMAQSDGTCVMAAMAALAANAVKSQRRKAANKMAADQTMNNINEQRIVVNTVAQKHRDSLSSMSTVDSLKPEVMQLMFSTRTKYCCVLQIRGPSMTK